MRSLNMLHLTYNLYYTIELLTAAKLSKPLSFSHAAQQRSNWTAVAKLPLPNAVDQKGNKNKKSIKKIDNSKAQLHLGT